MRLVTVINLCSLFYHTKENTMPDYKEKMAAIIAGRTRADMLALQSRAKNLDHITNGEPMVEIIETECGPGSINRLIQPWDKTVSTLSSIEPRNSRADGLVQIWKGTTPLPW